MEAQPQYHSHLEDEEDEYYDQHAYDDTSHLELFSSLYSGLHSKIIAEHMLVIKRDPRYQRMRLRYAPGWTHKKDIWQRIKRIIDPTLIPYIGVIFYFTRAFRSTHHARRAVRLLNTLRQYRVSQTSPDVLGGSAIPPVSAVPGSKVPVAPTTTVVTDEVLTPDGTLPATTAAYTRPFNATDQEKLIMALLEPDLRHIEVTTDMHKVETMTNALIRLFLLVGPMIVAPPLVAGEPVTKLPLAFLATPIAKIAGKIEKKKKLKQEKTLKSWPYIATNPNSLGDPASSLAQEHSFNEANIRDLGIRKNVHRKWGATRALLVYLGMPADRDVLYGDYEASRLFLKGLLGARAEDDLLAMRQAVQPLLAELDRQERETPKDSPYDLSRFPPILRGVAAASADSAPAASSAASVVPPPPPPAGSASPAAAPAVSSVEGEAAAAAAEGKPGRGVGVGFALWALLFRLYDCWRPLPYVAVAHAIGDAKFALSGRRHQKEEIRRQRHLLRDVQVVAAQLPPSLPLSPGAVPASPAAEAAEETAGPRRGLPLPFRRRRRAGKAAGEATLAEVRGRLLAELRGADPSGEIPAGWVVRQFGREDERVVGGWLRALLPLHPLARGLLRPLEGPFAQLPPSPPQSVGAGGAAGAAAAAAGGAEGEFARWQELRESLLAEADRRLRWLSRLLARRFCRGGQVWGCFARQAYPDFSGPLSASPLAHAAQSGPLKLQGLMLWEGVLDSPPDFGHLAKSREVSPLPSEPHGDPVGQLRANFAALQSLRSQLTGAPPSPAPAVGGAGVAGPSAAAGGQTGAHFLFAPPTPEGDEALRCLLRLAVRPAVERPLPVPPPPAPAAVGAGVAPPPPPPPSVAAAGGSPAFFVLADPQKERRLVGLLGDLGFVPGQTLSASPAENLAASDLGSYQTFWSPPSL